MPFTSGIFANHPKNLLLETAFPKFYKLLKSRQGKTLFPLLKKNKTQKKIQMLSFENGNVFQFVKALLNNLKINLRLNHTVEAINLEEKKIYFKNKEERFDFIISALPSYALAQCLQKHHSKASMFLREITYVPCYVIFLTFSANEWANKKKLLNALGYLTTEQQDNDILGVLFDSSLFKRKKTKFRYCSKIFFRWI